MSRFHITGGQPLSGEIVIAGNKNAALPIIAATVLTDEPCIIHNVPAIRDVDAMLRILENLGKSVQRGDNGSFEIAGAVSHSAPDDDLVKRLRASVLYMGALLGKTGEATLAAPGGCVIGRRRLDSHFHALRKLGAGIEHSDSHYRANLTHGQSAHLFLPEASVTATENAMMLASRLPGTTIIENAASEPHVADLALVLQKMGAKVSGGGSNRLAIKGQKRLGGFEHTVVADHIEAGTFAIAAGCTGGEIIMQHCRHDDFAMMDHILSGFGMQISYPDASTIQVKAGDLHAPASRVQVGLWPGFPTDLMSPLIVLATQASGNTLCHDWMFEARMFFVDKLIAMGAEIVICDPHRVIVNGKTQLRGQSLSSPDIRAGIALVIAALCARGESEIEHAELVDRGYEHIVGRLQGLGGKIARLP